MASNSKSHDRNTLFYPYIFATYAEILEGMPEHEVQAIKPFLKTCLPAPNAKNLNVCFQSYNDHFLTERAAPLLEESFYNFLSALTTEELLSSAPYGTTHPVAYSIEKLLSQISSTSPVKSKAIRFFLTFIQEGWKQIASQTASCLYNDILSCRYLTLQLCNNPFLSVMATTDGVLETLEHWVLNGDKHEFRNKWQATKDSEQHRFESFARLYKQEEGRYFGVPQRRHRSDRTSRENADRLRSQTDDYSAPKGSILRFPSHLSDTSKHGTPSQSKYSAQPISQLIQEDKLEAGDSVVSVQMPDTPNSSPHKRQIIYRQTFINHQAASNNPSLSDISLHSEAQIGFWLNNMLLMHQEIALFCFLLWCTGIEASRLMRTTTKQDTAVNEDIRLDLEKCALIYQVHNHAAAVFPSEEKQPINHWMLLELPQAWCETIIDMNLEYPFQDIPKQYKDLRLKLDKQATDDIPLPHLSNWHRSVPTFDQKKFHLIDSMVKSGKIERHQFASSAYRSLDIVRINELFQQRLNSVTAHWFGLDLSELNNSILTRKLSCKDNDKNFLLGSWFYHPIQALRPLTEELYKKMRALKKAIRYSTQGVPVENFIHLSNIFELNFYLLLQIATMGRPIGPHTQIHASNSGIFCSDKASSLYHESKLLPALSEDGQDIIQLIHIQMTAIEHYRKVLKDFFINEGIRWVDKTSHKGLHLPIELTHSNGITTLRDFSQSGLTTTLGSLNLSKHWPDHIKRNIFRHIASTDLPPAISDSCINETLGHKHPGMDYWGFESSAAACEYQNIFTNAQSLIRDIKFKLISMDGRLLNGKYITL